jgi:uncharacterized protein with HEPN domain
LARCSHQAAREIFSEGGEAVKQLSPATRQQEPEIPWKAIAGMRDVLIHDYMGVDLEAV